MEGMPRDTAPRKSPAEDNEARTSPKFFLVGTDIAGRFG